jgi:hypothetical protein
MTQTRCQAPSALTGCLAPWALFWCLAPALAYWCAGDLQDGGMTDER